MESKSKNKQMILRVQNLKKYYPILGGVLRREVLAFSAKLF